MTTILNIGGILAKICSLCGVAKELEKFNVHRSAKDGLQSKCAVCYTKNLRMGKNK